MADKDIIDFNKSQFDIMVDMLVLSGMSKDDAIVKVTKDFEDEGMVLKNRGGMMNINRMTAPLGYAHGGFEDRMSMLKKAMMDTEEQRRADMATGDPEMERTNTFGTITEDNIFDVAMTIARQQRDTSEENINLIINQLMALSPSMEQTMRKELTPTSTKGLKYLFDKLNVATGRKSDPRLNRSVGFGRVE
mgnify:CR=1 FL=1